MTYRLPKKTVKPEDVKKARDDGFMSGYIICLANMTTGGRDIDNTAVQTWEALGSPTAKTVAKLGLSSLDRRTCTLLRIEQKIRRK